MNADVFDPGNGQQYLTLMKRARSTNLRRDQCDHSAGFEAPSQGSIADHLRNAISAIAAGVSVKDWDCVAEGLDMLQNVELRVRKR